MKEVIQRKIFDYLLKNKIYNFVGVPDSTMKYFIDQGLKRSKILIATREEEAIGIAAGMSLFLEVPKGKMAKRDELISKYRSNSLVFMQNAGFANSLSSITSLLQLYKIPMILLIGWRGYLKTDAPEHLTIGKIQPSLLKTLKIESKILTKQNWKKNSDWAIKNLQKNQISALIIRREFND